MHTPLKKISLFIVAIGALGLLSVTAKSPSNMAVADSAMSADQHVAYNAAELQWADAPPFLPAGAKFTVLQGDPGKKGVFTIRLQVPSGYRIPPHTHPTTENVTVVSGTMNFGMGDTFSETGGKAVAAGGFACMPAGMKHFAWATGETVVQVHGMGPFMISYCHPEDDPRTKK